jgi:hypothetical protein
LFAAHAHGSYWHLTDIAPIAENYTFDRATARQRKTGRPVRFELTEPTRQAIDD